MDLLVDENKFKELIKDAFTELFCEKREIFYDVFSEIFEDIAMHNAIKEGENTNSVSREEVFRILEC